MDKKIKIKPKKQLGQNFLTQIGIIKKLIFAAQIAPEETILEIGPGTGALTAELLKTGNCVIAIEKDREMAAILEEKFKTASNFELINKDALKFNESQIAPKYKIAANLPFYLAAPLIRKFLESKNPPALMSIIVQKEVAQRICARTPKMNLLALSVQFYARPKIISYVSRGCFWPVPKVDCAILKIVPDAKKEIRQEKIIAEFFAIAKAGFAHPRKQLANNLAQGFKMSRAAAQNWLAKNNLPPAARPETLSLENWISLAQTFPL